MSTFTRANAHTVAGCSDYTAVIDGHEVHARFWWDSTKGEWWDGSAEVWLTEWGHDEGVRMSGRLPSVVGRPDHTTIQAALDGPVTRAARALTDRF